MWSVDGGGQEWKQEVEEPEEWRMRGIWAGRCDQEQMMPASSGRPCARHLTCSFTGLQALAKPGAGNHRTGSSTSLPLNTKLVGNLRPALISKAKPRDTLGGSEAVGCDWNIDYLERFGKR